MQPGPQEAWAHEFQQGQQPRSWTSEFQQQQEQQGPGAAWAEEFSTAEQNPSRLQGWVQAWLARVRAARVGTCAVYGLYGCILPIWLYFAYTAVFCLDGCILPRRLPRLRRVRLNLCSTRF